MPRRYSRKTAMGLVPHATMLDSVKQVTEQGKSLRKVAEEKGVSKSVIQRYVKKYERDKSAIMSPNYRHKMVFNTEQEHSLVAYLKLTSKMFHGLTTLKTKQLAYQMAVRNGLNMPEKWKEDQMAGHEWLKSFLKRNQTLAIRSPEATSLARATAFNEHTVRQFFDLLEQLIKTTKVVGNRIYNLDETGMTTVQKVPKLISTKGLKQVGQITSRERGELVTLCAIVCVSGSALPPVFVFPRKNFRDIFLTGAPEGSLGLAAESGWMNATLFVNVIEHIIQWTSSTKDNPIILVLDNHESHLSLQTLESAKEHGVNIITLPPHTSHKTQPLDRSVFGPLKIHFNSAANGWMMQNPGKTISIYQMGQLIGDSWLKAASPSNIIAGFRTTGIWPFDRTIFKDDEFLPSSVTDRPEPVEQPPRYEPAAGVQENQTFVDPENPPIQAVQITPHEEPQPETSTKNDEGFVTPERILGYPKAPERKVTKNCGRKKGKTMVATSTPELKRMRTEAEEKNRKAAEKTRRAEIRKAKKQLYEKTIADSVDSSSESDSEDIELAETDGDNLDESDSDNELVIGKVDYSTVKVDSFVLVEFIREDRPKNGKTQQPVYYIAMVLSEPNKDGDLNVDFFRKSQKVRNKFIRPNVPDVAEISQDQIQAILPKPVCNGTTSRTKDGAVFPIDFGHIDIR